MVDEGDSGVSGIVLVLLLIAVLGFAVFTQFGDTARMWFKSGGCRMSSDSTTTIITQSTGLTKLEMDSDF